MLIRKKKCYLCKEKILLRKLKLHISKCIPKDLNLYSKNTCPHCNTFIRNNNIVRHTKLCEVKTPEEREILKTRIQKLRDTKSKNKQQEGKITKKLKCQNETREKKVIITSIPTKNNEKSDQPKVVQEKSNEICKKRKNDTQQEKQEILKKKIKLGIEENINKEQNSLSDTEIISSEIKIFLTSRSIV